MRLKTALRPIEPVRPADPCFSRSKKLSVRTGHGNPCWCCLPISTKNLDFNPPVRLQILSLRCLKPPLPATRKFLNPQLRIPTAVRDECNLLSIRRPPRVRVVPIPIRNRKRVAPVRRHHPELVPLPP